MTGGLFVALAGLVALLGAFSVDVAARDAMLALASPALVAVLRVVNYAGAWPVLLPATLLLYVVFPRARARWWAWPALMIVAPLAEGGLKLLLGRPRPEGTALGFPSGHATAAAAFFGAVLYLAGSLPRGAALVVRALAGVMIALVGLARVILRAHWPSDAVGGIALGLALASLAALVASGGVEDPGTER